MAMRLDRGTDELEEVHGINVTPFIDVMLVLLIIFMVAAPLATVDIAVDLPSSSAEPQQRPDKPVYLTLKSDLTLAIGDDVGARLAAAKPQLALYIGGMGAKDRNFYHTLATRYGFGAAAERIQALSMAGRKSEAIDAVPDELVRNVSLIGPPEFLKERVAAFAEAGVTTLLVSPLANDRTEYLRYVAELIGMMV